MSNLAIAIQLEVIYMTLQLLFGPEHIVDRVSFAESWN